MESGAEESESSRDSYDGLDTNPLDETVFSGPTDHAQGTLSTSGTG